MKNENQMKTLSNPSSYQNPTSDSLTETEYELSNTVTQGNSFPDSKIETFNTVKLSNKHIKI